MSDDYEDEEPIVSVPEVHNEPLQRHIGFVPYTQQMIIVPHVRKPRTHQKIKKGGVDA